MLGSNLEHVKALEDVKKGKGSRHDQEPEEQVQVADPGRVETGHVHSAAEQTQKLSRSNKRKQSSFE